MFTENVSISKVAINAATATIHDIDCFANGMVTSIIVQLMETNVKIKPRDKHSNTNTPMRLITTRPHFQLF
jgi:hypothetical protein